MSVCSLLVAVVSVLFSAVLEVDLGLGAFTCFDLDVGVDNDVLVVVCAGVVFDEGLAPFFAGVCGPCGMEGANPCEEVLWDDNVIECVVVVVECCFDNEKTSVCHVKVVV